MDRISIGTKIQNLREKQGLSREEIAKKLTEIEKSRVKSDTYRKYEEGVNLIPVDRLYEVADVLDCDVDYLTGRQNFPRKENADVNKVTGLSDNAINTLKTINTILAEQYPITDAETDKEHELYLTECVEGALHGLSDLICKPDFFPIMDKTHELHENWELNYKGKSVSDLNKGYIDSRQQEILSELYFLEKQLIQDLIEPYIDGTEERK